MKSLRQTCAVAVLTLLLSASAFAGQVNCPGVASTTPPPTESTATATDTTATTETTVIDSITTHVILAIVSLIS